MKSFRIQNIKSFKDSGEIDIRPITVFIGRNSSGKSSLIRFPLVLKQSFDDNFSGPLIFNGDYVDYGGKYADVVFRHNVNEKIRFSFTIPGNFVLLESSAFIPEEDKKNSLKGLYGVSDIKESFIEITTEIVNILDNNIRKLVIDYFEIKINKKVIYVAQFIKSKKLYKLIVGDQNSEKEIKFNSILPTGEKNPLNFSTSNSKQDVLNFCISLTLYYFQKCLSLIQYIGPFRSAPARDYLLLEGMYNSVSKEGKTATHIFAQKFLQKDQKFLDAINKWFKDNLNLELGIRIIENNKYEVIITDLETKHESNLADVGYGISQILPIVIQTFCENRDIDAPPALPFEIQIIEQPELHLHPHAQSNLADLFIQGYQAQPNQRFLIETHSRNLILRLRRRVAEGVIAPEDVAIYYVKPGINQSDPSTVEKLEITQYGEIPDWPDEFFDQAYQDVIAIKNARAKSQENEDDTVW